MSLHIRHLVSTLAVASLGLAFAPSSTEAAQEDRRLLAGRVVDEAGAPLAGVEVSVRGSSAGTSVLETTTDTTGEFEIALAGDGPYALGIRAPARYPIAELLQSAGASSDTRHEYVLEPVVVGEDADSSKVLGKIDANWQWRMRRNTSAVNAARHGFVITTADIREQRPNWTSDLLFNTQGFRVLGVGTTARVIGSRSRCAPAMFIDGQEAGELRVNDVPPDNIELLVLFRGNTAVPNQFQLARNTSCGLIAMYLH